jgi:hypothetical protein
MLFRKANDIPDTTRRGRLLIFMRHQCPAPWCGPCEKCERRQRWKFWQVLGSRGRGAARRPVGGWRAR